MTLRLSTHTQWLAIMLVGVFSVVSHGQRDENGGSYASVPSATADIHRTAQFRSGVDLVSLDVCVRGANGQFVSDLSADDFVILENGRRQQISLLLPPEAVPLEAVLLIDVSQSMSGPKLAHAVEAARQFASSLRDGDRLEIMLFNRRAMRVHELNDDPETLARTFAARVETMVASSLVEGSTALYDALVVATNDLVRARRGTLAQTRQAIVLLSDGEDTSSRMAFEDVLPLIRRSGVLVYGVSLRTDQRGRWLGANWPMLQLARDTGARALGVPRLEALADLYRDIEEEVHHLYRMAYVSSDVRRDGQWRNISVHVPEQNVRATTRAGYYAPRAVTSPEHTFGAASSR